MAMRGNVPAIFGPSVKKPAARKANAVQTKMPLPAPLAPTKPLAPKVSTKPSDRPMGQASMRLTRPTSGVAPLPKLPSLTAKPVSATPRDTRSRRPKTGMK